MHVGSQARISNPNTRKPIYKDQRRHTAFLRTFHLAARKKICLIYRFGSMQSGKLICYVDCFVAGAPRDDCSTKQSRHRESTSERSRLPGRGLVPVLSKLKFARLCHRLLKRRVTRNREAFGWWRSFRINLSFSTRENVVRPRFMFLQNVSTQLPEWGVLIKSYLRLIPVPSSILR